MSNASGATVVIKTNRSQGGPCSMNSTNSVDCVTSMAFWKSSSTTVTGPGIWIVDRAVKTSPRDGNSKAVASARRTWASSPSPAACRSAVMMPRISSGKSAACSVTVSHPTEPGCCCRCAAAHCPTATVLPNPDGASTTTARDC
ncbi:Uncharacterised protein [Mycobacteroides abscessus subsp. massiliense]|nr:Uncharacterised protein [Mycobacteroides abscessus subsp. massiliense]